MALVASPTSSTNYNPRYSIVNFLPYIEVQYNNGFVETIPDFLDWNFNKIQQYCVSYKEVIYDGITPLTTLCYKTYGNTSILWLLCMYNGIMHPKEVAAGTILKFPDITQVEDYLNQVVSNQGKVVVI